MWKKCAEKVEQKLITFEQQLIMCGKSKTAQTAACLFGVNTITIVSGLFR